MFDDDHMTKSEIICAMIFMVGMSIGIVIGRGY